MSMSRPQNGNGHTPNERSPLLHRISSSEVTSTEASTEDELQSQKMAKRTRNVSRPRGIAIVLCLFCLIFMQTANTSLLTTIQSSIAEDLGAYASVSWFASAYLIACSSTPAVAGRLCQMFGAHNYALVSALIFATGVLITSSAKSFTHFLVGRAISGLGAAAGFPVGIIIVIELTSVERRGLFMGLLNSGFTMGLALGAVIAGALEPIVGWRAIFWMQTPLLVLAGFGLYTFMPRQHVPEKYPYRRQSVAEKFGSIDYAGVFTLIGSIVLLLLSLSSHSIMIEPIIFSIVLLVAFVVIETNYAANPIIPARVLRSRGTLLTCLSTLGMMMARYVVILYTPIYLMGVRAWGPAQAGTGLLAVNGGFAVGGTLVGWLHIRRAGSYYTANIVTFILFSIALFLISRASTAATPTWVYFLLCLLNGCITGAALNYTLVHLLHLTPPSTHFIASSVVAMFRGFGGSFGSAIGGGIFARVLKSSLEQGFKKRGLTGREELVTKLLGTPRLVAGLIGPDQEVAIEGYEAAVKALFTAGAGLALVAAMVQACTGWLPERRSKDEDVVIEGDEEVAARRIDD